MDFEQHVGTAFLASLHSRPGTSMGCIPVGTLARGRTCIVRLSTQTQLPSGQIEALL